MNDKNIETQLLRNVHLSVVLGIKNTGRRISIRCPLHNEKSASMVIYPDGSYYCYGCTAHGGNAIDLLMAMGATFIEAKEELQKYI
jgi:DNA primase